MNPPKSKRVIHLFIFALSLFASMPMSHAQIEWNSTIDVADVQYGNNFPRITTNASGEPLIIWGRSRNCNFVRWTGTEFTEPIRLNQNDVQIAEANWMGPEITAHGDTIYVVFKQYPETAEGSHIWCTRSIDGGRNFTPPVRVDDIGEDVSRFATVTTDDLGNPIIGFMKFDPDFGEARWVVTVSTDYGMSFQPDVLASKWSNPEAEVCDCCPGAVRSSGSTVAMIFRDNNNNIRDNWVGISNDGGNSFNGGMNVDQLRWYIESCPASGPDGLIIGDTVYTTFMNAASGAARSYFNKSSISNLAGSKGIPLTDSIDGLRTQNNSRIANYGNAVAVVWKQVVDGMNQLPIIFTENIHDGLPTRYDTILLNSLQNPDVALNSEEIFVVWQDNSGVVKFRSGSYSTTSSLEQDIFVENLNVFPNPSSQSWSLTGNIDNFECKIELLDAQGRLLQTKRTLNQTHLNIEIGNAQLSNGIYFIRISNKSTQFSIKVVKN